MTARDLVGQVDMLIKRGEALLDEAFASRREAKDVIQEATSAFRKWAVASNPLALHWCLSFSLPATVEMGNYGKLDVTSRVQGTAYCKLNVLHALNSRAVCLHLYNIRTEGGATLGHSGVIRTSRMDLEFTQVICLA